MAAAAGCSGDSEQISSGSDTGTQTVTTQAGSDIQLKSYEFPEFLSEIGKADLLSNPVYLSFDSAQIVVEPETQPFDGYQCTACIADSYYVFKEGDSYGLMNSYGTVLLEPDGIEKISAVAENLIRVRYSDGTTGYFTTEEDSVSHVFVEDFDSTRVGFANSTSEDGSSQVYTLQLDGEDIYDTAWSSFEEVDIRTLDTEADCEAIYKTTLGSAVYYIAFDKFYNFTVYEAAYGFVSLKIGGEYGECYIFGSDDYAELKTLISSFGSESDVSAPSKDEGCDYIQITLGLSGDNARVLTVSSDGYSLMDNVSGSSDNKYFTVMSEETFSDLVRWVDSTLKAEYVE
jgi:hypothetical protein